MLNPELNSDNSTKEEVEVPEKFNVDIQNEIDELGEEINRKELHRPVHEKGIKEQNQEIKDLKSRKNILETAKGIVDSGGKVELEKKIDSLKEDIAKKELEVDGLIYDDESKKQKIEYIERLKSELKIFEEVLTKAEEVAKIQEVEPKKDSKVEELREKLIEFKEKRERLARAESNYKKYEGVIGGLRGKISKEDNSKVQEELETARDEYELARAEYIGEKSNRMLQEQMKLADARAEELSGEKSWTKKITAGYKKLGEWNIGKLIGEEKMEKLISQADDSLVKKVGKGIARFITKTVSVRSAISLSLVGVGVVAGGGAVGIGMGALVARRALGGIGSSVGSYDLMRGFSDRKLRKEISLKDIKKLSDEELMQRMDKFDISAELNGGKVRGHETYKALKLELNERLKAGDLDKDSLSVLVGQSDERHQGERDSAKNVRNAQKVAALSIGVISGSGLVARGIRKSTEFLFDGGDVSDTVAPAAPEGVRFNLSGGKSGVASTGAPTLDQGQTLYATQVDELPVEIPRQVGKSVWQEAQKQLSARFQDFDELSQASQTYRIDELKDLIMDDPKQYGLPDGVDFSRITEDQIRAINWNEVIGDAGIDENIDPNLSPAQEASIDSYKAPQPEPSPDVSAPEPESDFDPKSDNPDIKPDTIYTAELDTTARGITPESKNIIDQATNNIKGQILYCCTVPVTFCG